MNKDRKRGCRGVGAEKRKDRIGVAGEHLGHPAGVCRDYCDTRASGLVNAPQNKEEDTPSGRQVAALQNATALAHRRDLANLHVTHCHTEPPLSPTERVARATAVRPLALAPSKTFLFASQRVLAWATFFQSEPRNKSRIIATPNISR